MPTRPTAYNAATNTYTPGIAGTIYDAATQTAQADLSRLQNGKGNALQGAFLRAEGSVSDAFAVVGLSLPGHDVWCDNAGNCDAFNVRVCLAAPMYDTGDMSYKTLSNVEYALKSFSGWDTAAFN